jgi:MFS family permease
LNSEQRDSQNFLWTHAFIRISALNLMLFIGFHMLTATFPFYIKDLGGDEAVAGLAAGLFSMSAVIVRPAVGWLLDHTGRKIILMIGLIGMVAMPLSYPITGILALAMFLRIIQGLFWSCSSTAANTIACDIVPKKRFGEGMGIFSTGPAIALAFGPLIGLYLMNQSGFSPLFIIASTFSAIAFILVIGVKDITLQKQSKSQNLKNNLINLIDKTALPASVTMLLFIMPFGAVATFVALYAVENGIANGGVFFTVMALTTVVIRLLTSKIIDKRGEAAIVYTSNACVAVSLALLVFPPSYANYIIAAFFIGAGLGMMQPAMQAMAMRIAPAHPRGSASSTFLCAFDIGIGLGGAIAGYLIKYFNYSIMFGSMIFILLVCLALYYFWARKSPSSFSKAKMMD